MYPELTSEEVKYTVEAIKAWDKAHAGKVTGAGAA
jgi:hypothetical protein